MNSTKARINSFNIQNQKKELIPTNRFNSWILLIIAGLFWVIIILGILVGIRILS